MRTLWIPSFCRFLPSDFIPHLFYALYFIWSNMPDKNGSCFTSSKGHDESNTITIAHSHQIFEYLVNKPLKVFLNSHTDLKSYHSGFRAKHSTTSDTSLVLNDIVSVLDKNNVLHSSLIKAFTTVDHLSYVGIDLLLVIGLKTTCLTDVNA